MKRLIAGIMVGAMLSQPLQTEARAPDPVEVTYEEAQELMQIASAEALNQGEKGMLYVMSVVINRVSSSEFPNNIHDVIHQPHQFATKGMESAEITPEVHKALADLECGNLRLGIIGFEKKNGKKLDEYFQESFTYLDHIFYESK